MTTIDDEARISEWSNMFAMNTRSETRGDPSYDAAARAVGKWNTVCDTAVALMREFLARAVKAEAKLAAAEKARDAALAAQNAKAMEELECLGDRGARWEWMPAGYQREIQLRLAALRSAPPAAPAGEAPAGDDDTLRRFLRRDDAHRGGELLLSVVADLCRRELARGER